MITVTYNSVSYECTTALKGTDYIHLLDANDQMIVSFDGVSDFTGFTISGGSWTTPTSADDCYLSTIGDDGVLRKGSHKCSDIQTKAITATVTISVADWNSGTTCTKNVTGVTSSNIVIVESSNALVSCTGQGSGTLTFGATTTPTSTTTVKVVIIP